MSNVLSDPGIAKICELFNILDNPDDLRDIGVENYNKRCDNKFGYIANFGTNLVL